ncbi:hypothetical protein [Staphylococcus warneri]|nr:hypothetical protein [Staphylococcus warneri]
MKLINSNGNVRDDEKGKGLKEMDDFENKGLINMENGRRKDEI